MLGDPISRKTFYDEFCSDDKRWVTPASKFLDFILKDDDEDDRERLIVPCLDTQSIEYLQPETLAMIRNIPFYLRNMEEPISNFTVKSQWSLELARYLIEDIESGAQLMDTAEVIRYITSWGIKPISIIDSAGNLISQTYLESNFDLNPSDLILCLEPLIRKSRVLDQSEVIRMLEHMQEKEHFDSLLVSLKKIVGTKKYRTITSVVEHFTN